MSYTVGDLAEVPGRFTDHTGAAADPSALTFTVKAPDGTTTVYTFGSSGSVIKDAVGTYRGTFTVTQPGEWRYEWEASGTVVDVQGDNLLVDPAIGATAGTYDGLLAGVGARLRNRTMTDFKGGGRMVGTFTEHTNPTREQAIEMIDQAAVEVAGDLGARDKLATSVQPLFDGLVKVRAAMFIEMGYFAGDVAAGHSIYPQLSDEYDKRLITAEKAVEQAGAGDEPGAVDDELLPIYAFPVVEQVPTRQEIIDRWIANGPYGLGW